MGARGPFSMGVESVTPPSMDLLPVFYILFYLL